MVLRQIWEPTPDDVIEVVRSLYDDEIKPLGRVIVHRLYEKNGRDSHDEACPKPKIEPKYLRELCERLPGVVVERAELREFAVVLKDDTRRVVNMFSPCDPYPAEFWERAREYFHGLEGSNARFPLGRYPFAVELVARKPPFLAGKTLGEVCHIVHLAILPRKILGVRGLERVPYALSDERAATPEPARLINTRPVQQQPQEPRAVRSATWADVRDGLRMMFNNERAPTPGTVLLTTVKRLFRNVLNLELNERDLGYTKLSEMLKDARLADVCRVGDNNTSVHSVAEIRPATISPAGHSSRSRLRQSHIVCTQRPAVRAGPGAPSWPQLALAQAAVEQHHHHTVAFPNRHLAPFSAQQSTLHVASKCLEQEPMSLAPGSWPSHWVEEPMPLAPSWWEGQERGDTWHGQRRMEPDWASGSMWGGGAHQEASSYDACVFSCRQALPEQLAPSAADESGECLQGPLPSQVPPPRFAMGGPFQ